jgi:hypothetical protein
METIFRRLCADVRLRAYEWGGEDWLFPQVARLTLRSGLFAGKERRKFIAGISRGFVDNFGRMGVGKKYEAGKVLGVRRLLGFLRRPEEAMKYAVKICTVENVFVRRLAFLFAVLPYSLFIRFKLYFFKLCKKSF